MKKYFSFLFFFILFQYTIMCQNKKQQFGLKIGVSLANFSNNSVNSLYHPRGISYDLGITTHIQIPNKIGFSAEVSYSRKNIKNDYFGYALNYLVLGIMPNYYFDKTETTIYTGGYVAVLVSSKVLNDNPKSGERFRQFDSGLTLGVNQKLIEISDFQVILDARINNGFINIRDETWQGKTKNYGYSLGLIFKRK